MPASFPVPAAVRGAAAGAAAPLLVVAVLLLLRGTRYALPPQRVVADRPGGLDMDTGSRLIEPHLRQDGDAAQAKLPSGADPWADQPWCDMQWTVYRGVAYDLQPFFQAHPGGNWLLQLAVRRDCTALLESYHLRMEVARKHIERLPVIERFPVDVVPRTPHPGDSALYATIKGRLVKELFRGGGQGLQRMGSMDAAAVTTLSFFAMAAVYAAFPSVLTGCLLGATGAWVGMVTQHPGNHGALSTNEKVNGALGLMADLVGGSGLCWQYHHNVSHHVHCNDEIMDEDVYSAYPILRLDERMPPKWYHKYQHLYMWPAFCMMHIVFFFGDFASVFGRRTKGAAMHGMDTAQKTILLLLKGVHLTILLGLPLYLHGSWALVLPGAVAYSMTWGLVLAILFAVSHNTSAQKAAGLWARGEDWAVQQVVTSADWGGTVACWMTGGLSLQVVHHLFPAVAAAHYPQIRTIVQEECERAGVPYAYYPNLWAILKDFVAFMRDVGAAPAPSNTPAAAP